MLALSDKRSLRRSGLFRSLAVWQNTPHSGILKQAQRSSAWRSWCTFDFRSHSAMLKIFCTNVASTSAMKQFGCGGIDLVRCLQTFAAFICHPTDYATLAATVVDSGSGRFVVENGAIPGPTSGSINFGNRWHCYPGWLLSLNCSNVWRHWFDRRSIQQRNLSNGKDYDAQLCRCWRSSSCGVLQDNAYGVKIFGAVFLASSDAPIAGFSGWSDALRGSQFFPSH